MNGPNKLGWYITLGWKGFPGTNTLAYWAHSQVVKKMKCCKCYPRNVKISPTANAIKPFCL